MWRSSVRTVARWAKLLNTARVTLVKAGSRASCCGVSGKTWTRPSGFDTGVKTFNSLTKNKEPLVLARDGVATWYGIRSTTSLSYKCNNNNNVT